MEALGRLRRQVPPPMVVHEPPDAEGWPAVERELGCGLPRDYKELIAAYGSGWFGGFLAVFNPAAQGAALRIQGGGMDQLALLRENRELDPDEPMPYGIYPEVDGLLTWGTTINGDSGYWLTRPREDPDAWTTVVGEVRGPGWYPYPGSLSAMLADLTDPATFRDVAASSILPAEWASRSPAFERL